ncbi:bifunctional UDP-N-acetylglucosamine diphosphorylase/glucosamine-1-phosphate N-acetyltransferase GlmU [Brucella pseudogrignonensis]|uniref:bifunctional UDP-N-acetylglucosamine diphosphorylase/glucosamine-1-phosphate N-acetyltransferase GlmU n=1 Tax=Brucella pseudogrignonensis TaxID=419475 RepID=UPI000CFD7003|nr:bifunctional UDP-N-acetylglucosamine diphosphorylase/glucosamine-1-phosphate N-acetyltransferase GlmU [Brucella pseudogrignonensis]MQP41129.1 bifunctional UDP-N-acetylglucosamine diphosphorylase/glucosamine-1-phosphate N-acetyltransferase GlmU [Ochrobactrum sp. MYb237]PQZ40470.1 bifunctional N-acetylglucosamine-1-phosphate uridyltransferase/glucosamine-1-phosphate acetyltransferase [Brucella pseudogrignonensis]PRA40036.1 bifunctional N-acetylglucosamine-1-phosphate uridyltransferase/glucosami
MTDRTCLSIVLAAGEGTRMKSNLPKVLHQVAGLPLVSHVVKAVQGTGKSDVALVVGRGADDVRGAVEKVADAVSAFEQKERLGTAHAVLAARAAIERGYDDLLIVFGDTPLIEAHSLQAARNKLSEGADVVVIGFRPASPHGYGRLIEEGGKLTAIIEEKEASEAQKKIGFCNGGLMAVRGSHALALLDAVDNKNAKGEYYLTDIVGLAHGKGLNVVAIEVPVDNVIGINNRAELAEAENIWQNRKRQEMMLAGVTLIAPENVFFSHDTLVETDVVIEPNVFFGQGVHVASGALIHAFSHIEGAKIGVNAEIGPFARLRPGANLGEKSKVGNFCEVKNAQVGKGAKINHLTYIGDATVGASSNIGAGTITCNYDGYNKYKTVIGENAFVGSNSSLVAPVSIGDNAYIASGSTITDDVPADALAFGRARQETKEGRGKILREKYAAIKAAKTSSK